MQQGKYIVLEGGDGCGKSTQAQLLVEHLKEKGIDCVRSREPGTTVEGEQIRNILLDKRSKLSPLVELFLFEAARTAFFEKDLLPILNDGKTVVSDRSCYSTLAYQGFGGGIDLDLINRLNKLATFEKRPDLAFIIDVEASKGLGMEENADRFAAKGPEYHRKVNQGYKDIALSNPDNTILIPYVNGNLAAMQTQIQTHVDKLF